ncbi:hypothetical protein RHMOL_Rhmol05G0024500 [Rhododendron molle]|uniref:Uncharacterized protein n=1 Tax=Rhododendron molle TaxID=49168 RepID=A0ACC0NKI9_RHOML|nr:hypothetical protein RHMOL_Rhmol05G0024500 [Rhododendron molle]
MVHGSPAISQAAHLFRSVPSADLIASESERLLKNVVRVHRQEEADLFYIPIFTTISFFLMEKQQCKALYRVYMKNAIWLLPAMDSTGN